MEPTQDFGALKDFKQHKVLMFLGLKDLGKEMSPKPRELDCVTLVRATERTTENG